MANRGWDSTLSGPGWPSTARTTGRTTGTDGAEAFVQGSKLASHGPECDPMDERSDLFPGGSDNLGTSHNR